MATQIKKENPKKLYKYGHLANLAISDIVKNKTKTLMNTHDNVNDITDLRKNHQNMRDNFNCTTLA